MNGTYGTMLFFPTASLAQAFSELENHTMCKLVGEFVAGRRRPFINAAGRTARIFRFQLGHFGTKFEIKENLHQSVPLDASFLLAPTLHQITDNIKMVIASCNY